MFQKNKNIKLIGTVVIGVLLVIAVITRFRIQSVNEYQNQKSNQIEDQQADSNNNNDSNSYNASQSGTKTDENGSEEQNSDSQSILSEEDQNQSEDAYGDDKADKANQSALDSNNAGQDASDAKNHTGESTQPAQSTQSGDNSQPGNQGNTSNPGNSDSDSDNHVTPTSITCSIEILCDKAVPFRTQINNPGIVNAIPENGVILSRGSYQIKSGMSAMQLLIESARQNGILLAINDGTYVTSIGGLAEKMVTPSSGWTYRINGTFVNIGAADYILKDGDVISWRYVCSYSDYWG